MENNQLQEKLEKLLKAYAHYFDVERDVKVEGGSFPAAASYHFREENYVATRAHTIYASEQHEYVYFYLTERLDLATLQKEIELSREAGGKKVTPHGEHMFSYVTLIILADHIDEDAKRALKRYRYRKNFWLTLHVAAYAAAQRHHAVAAGELLLCQKLQYLRKGGEIFAFLPGGEDVNTDSKAGRAKTVFHLKQVQACHIAVCYHSGAAGGQRRCDQPPEAVQQAGGNGHGVFRLRFDRYGLNGVCHSILP